MIQDSRACTKCAEIKPPTDFSKAPRGKYGHKASCKACDASRHAAQFVPKVVDEEKKRERYTKNWDKPKHCIKCDQVKDRSEFSISRQGKYGPILKTVCKACHAERERAWLKLSKDGQTTNRRRLHIKNTYDITPDEYAEMLLAQGGGCAVCGGTETATRGGKRLSMPIDHCHGTGRIRGILCNGCNRAVGLLGDDAGRLRRAVNYLRQSGT